MPARHRMLPSRHWMLPAPHKYHVCPLSYNLCRYLFLSVYLVYYTWSHACKQMSYELRLICTIWLSIQLLYKVQLCTAHWLRTVISITNLWAIWNMSVQQYSWLLRPRTIYLLFKATEIPISPSIDVSKFPHGFILQLVFVFFNV